MPLHQQSKVYSFATTGVFVLAARTTQNNSKTSSVLDLLIADPPELGKSGDAPPGELIGSPENYPRIKRRRLQLFPCQTQAPVPRLKPKGTPARGKCTGGGANAGQKLERRCCHALPCLRDQGGAPTKQLIRRGRTPGYFLTIS